MPDDDWDVYRSAAERVWARHKPPTWFLMLLPSRWGGRATARSVAKRLVVVVTELEGLDPPPAARDAVNEHYLTPLREVSSRLKVVAANMPSQTHFIDAVQRMQEDAPLFPEDRDHNYVVDHGLPQWWLPKTTAWERRA